MPLSEAQASAIGDADFEIDNWMKDGYSTPSLRKWTINSGSAGRNNPTASQYFGEKNAGKYNVAMYMRDNANVSQHVAQRLSPSIPYVLEFDVGFPVGEASQDYIIRVTTNNADDPTQNGTVFELQNPVRLTRAGYFEDVRLPFYLPDSLSGDYTISVITQGTGLLHFDNFEMYESGYRPVTPFLQTVAYGHTFYHAETDSLSCIVDYSLDDSDPDNPTTYLIPGEGACECVNSDTAQTGRNEYITGDIHTFYQCLTNLY